MHVERVAVWAGEHAFDLASGGVEFKRKKAPLTPRMEPAAKSSLGETTGRS